MISREKLSKKIWMKNLWKCWGFVKIEFLDKNLTFQTVCVSKGATILGFWQGQIGQVATWDTTGIAYQDKCQGDNLLTNSHSMLLKNWCVMISVNPASELHPNLSTGFLFKKPLRMEAARTLKERGMRMVFSKITEKNRIQIIQCQYSIKIRQPFNLYSVLKSNHTKCMKYSLQDSGNLNFRALFNI